MISLREGWGTRVLCLRGLIWLTQEGDSRDIFLRPGEEWEIQQTGLVLVQALEETRIQFLQGGYKVEAKECRHISRSGKALIA